MEKIILTKNELKKQKDHLKRFNRFLPILRLKKERLQKELFRIDNDIASLRLEKDAILHERSKWVGLLAQDPSVAKLLSIDNLELTSFNVAGVDIPRFEQLRLDVGDYDLFDKPLWYDRALEEISKLLTIDAKLEILKMQRERIATELRRANQRVNLFEKVKIPEAQKSIRRIRIYLGDQQTAAVVRGKICKKKLLDQPAY